MFFVIFNEINYYEVLMKMFIRLERCKDKESKVVKIFEYEKLKFLPWMKCSRDF